MIPLLVGISILSFAVIHLAPGDPVDLLVERTATPEQRAIVRQIYGFDEPVTTQYWLWFTRLLRGDFGTSFVQGRAVLDMYMERLPNTLYLNFFTLMVIYMVGLPVGIISALRQYSRLDHCVTTVAFWGQAMPSFWLAYVLIFFVALRVDFIPISGMATYGYTVAQVGWWSVLADRFRYLILPVAVMAFSGIAIYARYMRSSMLEVIRQDYVRTARSKGLTEKVVMYRHALRNALLPIITLLGMELPILFAGSVIIEMIFSWPGLGLLSFRSIMQRDYVVVMAFNTIGALLMVMGNFLADVLYAVADPRIKYS